MNKKILISEFVSSLRNENQQNIRDFAKDHNLSKAQVSKYENGKCDSPTLTIAIKFCNAFKIPFDKFQADFYYEDENIKKVLSAGAHLKKRLGSEWSDTFGFKLALNFYKQYEKTCNLKSYEKCNPEKEYRNANDDEVFFDRAGKCLSMDEKEIWICTFLRVPEFSSKPRNINYDYMMSQITTAASLPKQYLGCSNFIFIVSSKSMYNYFSRLPFHSYNTNAYLAFTEDGINFKEICQLYGKEDFLNLKDKRFEKH